MTTALVPDRRWPDLATVVAIAAVVYVLAIITHEGIGHAGSGLLFGVRPAVITTTYVRPGGVPAEGWQRAATSAAGSIANLIAGIGAMSLTRFASAPWWRYFLWLSGAVNLFFCGSYVMASSLLAFGDWADVESELRIGPAGKAALAAAGVVVCLGALRLARRQLEPFLPAASPERRRTARALTRTAWIAGTVVIAAASQAGNRQSDLFYALGWTLLGTAWLLLVPAGTERSGPPHDALALPRSRAWIAAGVIASFLAIAVLGRGFYFGAAAKHVRWHSGSYRATST